MRPTEKKRALSRSDSECTVGLANTFPHVARFRLTPLALSFLAVTAENDVR